MGVSFLMLPGSLTPPRGWASKKQEHDDRPANGWRNAFEEKTTARNLNKRHGFFSYEDRRRLRMAESGWTNTIVKLPAKPPHFSTTALEEEEAIQLSLRERGNYCLTCMGLVSNSKVDRANCELCSSVIHRRCIIISDSTLSTASNSACSSSDSATHSGFVSPLDSASSSSKDYTHFSAFPSRFPSVCASPTSATYVKWMCPDCIEDVDFKKKYRGLRHRLQYRDSVELFAIVKIQSFARMVRYRLDYILAKIGFTALQKVFHTKIKWVKLKKFEEKRPRPFRLKINDIRLFMKNPECVDDDIDGDTLPKGPNIGKKIGECGAGPYDVHFRCGEC